MRYLLSLLILLTPCAVHARISLTKWTLKNGLKVTLIEDHKAPVVSVQVFYRAGAKEEPADKRGIAHMFEHMMFKGSRYVAPEAHARFLDSVGGNSNAFTMDDVTGYLNNVPPQALDFTLKLEAERMRNLSLTQSTIDSEREVVKEELRVRVENNPVQQAFDALLHLAYQKHPYQQFAAGQKQMLDTVTIEDCKKFYEAYYQPDNATLIVAGDVSEKTLRPLVDKYFAPLKAHGPAARNSIVEPVQNELREQTLKIPAQLPVMIGAYHIPPATHDDTYVLEVIGQILSSGESSRLHKRLVKKEQIALAAGGFVFSREDPGLFITYAVSLPGADQKRIRAIFEEEVAKLVSGNLDKREIQKAKNQLAAQAVFEQEQVETLATRFGVDEVVAKNQMRIFYAEAMYDEVKAKDIARVARTYFTKKNLSIVTLEPTAGAK